MTTLSPSTRRAARAVAPALFSLVMLVALTGCDDALEPTGTAEFAIEEPVTAIVVIAEEGWIGVRAADVETVSGVVTQYPTGGEVRGNVDDGVLTLEVDCSGGRRCRFDFDIETPPGVTVQVESGSGAVFVTGVTGDITVDTGSGAIDIEGCDCTAGGELDLHSGSGAIRVVEHLAPVLRADTGSGSIEATGLVADVVEADTGSGSVDLTWDSELTGSPSAVTVDSGSGAVRLVLEAAAYDIHTDTGSGQVVLDGVTHDSGSDRTLELETGSGSITVTGR